MKYSHLFLWSSTFCLLLSACQSGIPSLQPEIGSTVTPLTVTQTLVLTPTALPAPDGTFLAFLDAWNDHNFSGMYSLLTHYRRMPAPNQILRAAYKNYRPI
jgi:hypothetical protein